MTDVDFSILLLERQTILLVICYKLHAYYNIFVNVVELVGYVLCYIMNVRAYQAYNLRNISAASRTEIEHV